MIRAPYLGFEAERWLTADIAAHGPVFTSGRCVDAEQVEGDGKPLGEEMLHALAETPAHFTRFAKLEAVVMTNLKGLGHGG